MMRIGGECDMLQQFGKRDAFPYVIETAPACHTMKIGFHFDFREFQELLIVPADRSFNCAKNTKIPGGRIKFRYRSHMEYRVDEDSLAATVCMVDLREPYSHACAAGGQSQRLRLFLSWPARASNY